jgi:hypothetical protein
MLHIKKSYSPSIYVQNMLPAHSRIESELDRESSPLVYVSYILFGFLESGIGMESQG